jgi:hypothetical protein
VLPPLLQEEVVLPLPLLLQRPMKRRKRKRPSIWVDFSVMMMMDTE